MSGVVAVGLFAIIGASPTAAAKPGPGTTTVAVFVPAVAVDPASSPASVPVISASRPNSPADDNDPWISGSAGLASVVTLSSVVTLYRSADCTGEIAAHGSALEFSFRGLEVSVPDNSVSTFSANATDVDGNVSSCSAPFSYREVTTAKAVKGKHKKKKHNRHNPTSRK